MVTRIFGLGLLAAGLACGSAKTASAAENAELSESIAKLVQPYTDNDVIGGMTVGVIQGDQHLVRGFGRLSATDERVSDGNTIYEIGSMSKVFTGLLLADAVVQGRVKLDQPAGELLPKSVKMPSFGERPITLQHLATHVSGFPSLPSNIVLNVNTGPNPFAQYRVRDLYAFLNDHHLERAPGIKSEYSNLAVGLLGVLLANNRETNYEQLLSDRIVKPLKLPDTTITLKFEQTERMAPPHTAEGELTLNWDFPALAGCGAIHSTVDDLLVFVQAMLNPPAGQLGEAIELAWKVHQPPLTTGDFALGLGWHVARDGETRWHNGQTGGYHADVFVNRQKHIAVVLLTNTATMEVDALAQDIIQLLAGAEVKPRKFEKVVKVSPEVLAKYVGRYELAPGVEFAVMLEGSKLMVQLTGQSAYQVFPRSETKWDYKVVPASITFKRNRAGECTALELFQNGRRQMARKIL